MQKFGTIQIVIDGVPGFTYDRRQNQLLAQNLTRITVGGGFGRPQVNRDTDNSEFATIEASVAFSSVLHASVIDATNPNFPEWETRTFSTSYPKYVLWLAGRRINAGAIASIIGDDCTYGDTVKVKAGHIAELLGETYDPAIHIPLTEELIAAAKEIFHA